MIEVVFLDVDGVVSDIQGRLGEIFDRDVEDIEPGEYDLARWLGIPEDELWAHPKVDREDFWSGLPKTKDAAEIWDAAHEHADDVCFLTAAVRAPHSASGKKKWLDRNYPGCHYLIGPRNAKALVARPGAVLVDDFDRNVGQWEDSGGHGVLVPRRWNSGHARADRTARDLRATLARLAASD